jgi:hypothetical protein
MDTYGALGGTGIIGPGRIRDIISGGQIYGLKSILSLVGLISRESILNVAGARALGVFLHGLAVGELPEMPYGASLICW